MVLRRLAFTAAAGLLGGVLLAGCGKTPLSERYLAERDFWRARAGERVAALRPSADDGGLLAAAAAYQKILARYPVQAATGEPAEEALLCRIRGAAAQAASRIYLRSGDRARAVAVLWNLREESQKDADSGLRVYGDLTAILAQGGASDSLIQAYREITSALPPATSDGNPIPLVVNAPVQMADALVSMGRRAEAEAALANSLAWYESTAAQHAGTALEVAVQVQKAEVLIRQGRNAEAESVLGRARALPAAAPFDAGILLSMAIVREQKLEDPAGAIGLLRDLIRLHPDDRSAPQAALRIGMALAEAGRPDSAMVAFSRAEKDYGRDPAVAAQARFQGARVLAAEGRGADAVRQLRSITADFPRTEVGLRAPLEVAAWYEKEGNTAAAQATLREAAAEYERLIQDLAGDRAQSNVVLAAMDYLSAVRLRLEDWPDAVQALLKRADTFPSDGRSALALAEAAAVLETHLGDKAGAARTLETLLQRYPRFPASDKAREKIALLKSQAGV